MLIAYKSQLCKSGGLRAPGLVGKSFSPRENTPSPPRPPARPPALREASSTCFLNGKPGAAERTGRQARETRVGVLAAGGSSGSSAQPTGWNHFHFQNHYTDPLFAEVKPLCVVGYGGIRLPFATPLRNLRPSSGCGWHPEPQGRDLGVGLEGRG